jgi:hypothetical protein
MNLAAWLLSMAGPLVLRALTVLGLGTLTFTGVTASLQGLIDLAVSNWASLGADILALASLAGIPQSLGIITGAMTARVGLWAAVSATKFIFNPAS